MTGIALVSSQPAMHVAWPSSLATLRPGRGCALAAATCHGVATPSGRATSRGAERRVAGGMRGCAMAAAAAGFAIGCSAGRPSRGARGSRPALLRPLRASSTPVEGLRAEDAVAQLHAAASGDAGVQRPPTEELLKSAVVLQRATPTEKRRKFLEHLAGGSAPGKRWRLVYTAGAEDLRRARQQCRTGSVDPGGLYVDTFATAVQRFDGANMLNENGIFGVLGMGTGRLLSFKGPFKWCNPSTLAFDSIKVCCGPWEFDLASGDGFDEKHVKELPFFNFIHVDDTVALAIGKSGGLALWARTSAEFERDMMKLPASEN